MISNKTKERINTIYYIGRTLQNRFNILCDLEINHKINSNEYQEELSRIYEIKLKIDEILNEYRKNYSEIIEYSTLLDETLNVFSNDDSMVYGVINSEDNSVNFLYNLFVEYALEHGIIDQNNSSYDALYENEEGLELFEELINDYKDYNFDDENSDFNQEFEDIDIIEKANEMEKTSYNIRYYKNTLYLVEFITKLLDAIEKEENEEIKNELIKIKYKIIYTNPCLIDLLVHMPEKALSKSILKKLLVNFYNNEDYDIKSIFDLDYSSGLLNLIEQKSLELSCISTDTLNAKVNTIIYVIDIQSIVSLLLDEYQIDALHTIKRKAISNASSNETKKQITKALTKTI